MSGTIKLEIKSCDATVVEAIAKKIIELTGIGNTSDTQVKSNDNDKTLTVGDVAALVHKTPQTIRKHIGLELLKAEKKGKSFIITKENYEKYVSRE